MVFNYWSVEIDLEVLERPDPHPFLPILASTDEPCPNLLILFYNCLKYKLFEIGSRVPQASLNLLHNQE